MASVSLDPSFHFFNPLPLTLGCKNEKRPSGLTELDLAAGNLVFYYCCSRMVWYTITFNFLHNYKCYSGLIS